MSDLTIQVQHQQERSGAPLPLRDLVWDTLRDGWPIMLTVDEVIDELQERGHEVYSRGAVRPHLTAMVVDGFARREVRDASRSPYEYGWVKKQ